MCAYTWLVSLWNLCSETGKSLYLGLKAEFGRTLSVSYLLLKYFSEAKFRKLLIYFLNECFMQFMHARESSTSVSVFLANFGQTGSVVEDVA